MRERERERERGESPSMECITAATASPGTNVGREHTHVLTAFKVALRFISQLSCSCIGKARTGTSQYSTSCEASCII